MLTIMYVLFSEILNTLGQVLIKKSTLLLEQNKKDSYGTFLKKIMRFPGIWLGLFFLSLGLVFWIMALSTTSLSVVFPLGSIYYILIFLASHFFLSEKIDRMRIIGTIFISVGIVLVALQ